jgi:ABC-type cobalamin/Fe3+-siderophores transport system ATPase subunit
MLQRLYINNFRCLENFDLSVKDMPSVLLIGKNGSGKSTIRFALEVFQKIGRGINRVRDLAGHKDFRYGQDKMPIRFEIEVLLVGQMYRYVLALELPEKFKEIRVLEEQLLIAGIPHYTREGAQVTLYKTSRNVEAKFLVDWHLVALPVIQAESGTDLLNIFKTWLAHILLLAPIPSLMKGDSIGETLEPDSAGRNFGEWFSGVLVRYPSAYSVIDKYLREVIPDIQDIQNEVISKDSKSMSVSFEANQAAMRVYFEDLSDGEKCFFICAVVLAANKFYGPLFCFWDEPDNYLSLHEVGHLVIALRRVFRNGAQIFMTSHNPEAIRKFSDENTLVVFRGSHLEPTRCKALSEFVASGELQGDLVNALILGDLL